MEVIDDMVELEKWLMDLVNNPEKLKKVLGGTEDPNCYCCQRHKSQGESHSNDVVVGDGVSAPRDIITYL